MSISFCLFTTTTTNLTTTTKFLEGYQDTKRDKTSSNQAQKELEKTTKNKRCTIPLAAFIII